MAEKIIREWDVTPAERIVLERMHAKSRKHGAIGTPEYRAWNNIKNFCRSKGRTICERWANSFADFLADIGPRPSAEYWITRQDLNGPYSPENCSWQNKRGRPQSSAQRESVAQAHRARTTHGCATRNETGTTMDVREYAIWSGMKSRCSNLDNIDYGGRGIKVCPEWIDDFAQFLRDVGPCPSPKHSIDRYPDNNGNYRPGNVRWATAKEQGRNTRRNRYIEYSGVTKAMSEWAEDYGLPYLTLRSRLRKSWDIHSALTLPHKAKRKDHRHQPG